MTVTLDDLMAELPAEQQEHIKKRVADLPYDGKAVKVLMKTGKLRDGVVKTYAYTGNITKLHYWLVNVKGLKKTQVVREDKIQTAS
jgi:hypothetical protein